MAAKVIPFDRFYIKSSRDLWGDKINPEILSLSELNEVIADQLTAGEKLHMQLFPPPPSGMFKRFITVAAIMAVAVGGAAIIAAGTTAAGGGAAAAAASASGATTGAATAAGTAAASGGLSATSMAGAAFSAAKTYAGYIGTAGKVAKIATGDSDWQKLTSAADFVAGSKSITDGAFAFVASQFAKSGNPIPAQLEPVIRARLTKEQKLYANWMRQQAARLRAQQLALSPAADKKVDRAIQIAGIVVPVGLFVLSRVMK